MLGYSEAFLGVQDLFRREVWTLTANRDRVSPCDDNPARLPTKIAFDGMVWQNGAHIPSIWGLKVADQNGQPPLRVVSTHSECCGVNRAKNARKG